MSSSRISAAPLSAVEDTSQVTVQISSSKSKQRAGKRKTYLGFLLLIKPLARDKEGNVVLVLRLKDIVGEAHIFLSNDLQARLLLRLPHGTLERILPEFKVATGKLQCSCCPVRGGPC